MFLNIKYKHVLNLNILVIKYTKHSDNSIDKGFKNYSFLVILKKKFSIVNN